MISGDRPCPAEEATRRKVNGQALTAAALLRGSGDGVPYQP
jgi:hypothetical protein